MLDAKFLLTVVVSAAAGAAITLLFGTQEGKDLLNGVSELEKQLRRDFERLADDD